MNDIQERLLDLIQSDFPITHEPYKDLAKRVGIDAKTVFELIRDLQAQGTIRRVGASFSSRHVGYASTLCAFAVEDARLDDVAAIVSKSPYVTHNYARENEFNLWFTVMGHGKTERDAIFNDLKAKAGIERALNLPADRLYKIRVDFSEMKNNDVPAEHGKIPQNIRTQDTDVRSFNKDDAFDVALLRVIQEDILELGLYPFEEIALRMAAHKNIDGELSSATEDDVLARVNEWKANGTVRRFGAMVRHQKMGYAYNGMSVWDVPNGKRDAVGNIMQSFPFVSHCYARPRTSDWQYNVYGMVHAHNSEELDARIAAIEAALQEILPHQICHDVLISTHEYKKTSMTYFPQE
ncbi:MAG: hypothetical protein IJV62_04335 [Eggerthellaceae bacterium]|nr:hypothetical protein [Eggerthellaceae bacterium]